MNWHRTHQNSPTACALADRHYSRAKVGSKSMMPPGRQIVLITPGGDAVWGSSWPYAHLLMRTWFVNSWMCSVFRNEGPLLSSSLIREAVAATRFVWPDAPADGMVTLIDAAKVRSTNPGCCFLHAGFRRAGYARNGLLILRLVPENMPEPCPPLGMQLSLLEGRTA